MDAQPPLFHHSLDWRFLLPLTDPKKIVILLEEDQDFSQALEQVGIGDSQQLSFSELKQNANTDAHSIVLPFGIPLKWVTAKPEDQVEFYSSVRRLISSEGCLLVGFNNIWNLRANSQKKYYPATPQRFVTQLKQAGFRSVTLFGAMPNLAIPEYIFELESRTIQFALQNRFRRKPAILRALRVLSVALGSRRISNFLPCYFAVATV
jgi:hypothetical protein